jgi:hypothetical protein
MKRRGIIVVVSLVLLGGVGVFLWEPPSGDGVGIVNLGRTEGEMPAVEFLITNRSSRGWVVYFTTMAQKDGRWARYSYWGSIVETHHLRGHAVHKEMARIPVYGESWRLVAWCSREPTPLSRAVDAVRRVFRLPKRPEVWIELPGPELKREGA